LQIDCSLGAISWLDFPCDFDRKNVTDLQHHYWFVCHGMKISPLIRAQVAFETGGRVWKEIFLVTQHHLLNIQLIVSYFVSK